MAEPPVSSRTCSSLPMRTVTRLTAVPTEIHILIWSYLLHSVPDLLSCELVCRSWRSAMTMLWGWGCAANGVPSDALQKYKRWKFAFLAHVHHFFWKHGVWGDFPSSHVAFPNPESYLLYDTYPNVGLLFPHELVTFRVLPCEEREKKRELFLRTMVPEQELQDMLGADAEHPVTQHETCLPKSRFKCEDAMIQTDLTSKEAVSITKSGIEVFHEPEGGRLEEEPLGPVGRLDTSGIPTEQVAVLHAYNGKVYALLKKPQGIQVWSTATSEKLFFEPAPGTYQWPDDNPYYTWKSQERFCFKDPSWFGVVIDDSHQVWVLDVEARSGGRRWTRLPVECPSATAQFGECTTPPPRATPLTEWGSFFPNPSCPSKSSSLSASSTSHSPFAPHHDPAPISVWTESKLEECQDPSLPPFLAGQCYEDDGWDPEPADVRVCGPNILLCGGRGVLDDNDVEGRAFIQLWRPECTTNLNSGDLRMRCVLQAKYDHILMFHCDRHRVYVLFHPFYLDQSQMPNHTYTVAVDVWDAWGGGFVCRRLGHDEDRCPKPFFEFRDLSPPFVQILHGDPENLLYYCSQYKDGASVLSVRQMGMLTSVREKEEMEEAKAQRRAVAPDVMQWWQGLSPTIRNTDVSPDALRGGAHWNVFFEIPKDATAPIKAFASVLDAVDENTLLFNASPPEGFLDPLRIKFQHRYTQRVGDIEIPLRDFGGLSRELLTLALVGEMFDHLDPPALHTPPLRVDVAAYCMMHRKLGGDKARIPPAISEFMQCSLGPVVSTQLAAYSPEKASGMAQASTTVWYYLNILRALVTELDTAGRAPSDVAAAIRAGLLSVTAGILNFNIKDMFVHAPPPVAFAQHSSTSPDRDVASPLEERAVKG